MMERIVIGIQKMIGGKEEKKRDEKGKSSLNTLGDIDDVHISLPSLSSFRDAVALGGMTSRDVYRLTSSHVCY